MKGKKIKERKTEKEYGFILDDGHISSMHLGDIVIHLEKIKEDIEQPIGFIPYTATPKKNHKTKR